MQKKVIASYEKVSQEVKSALFQKYPEGFDDLITPHKDVIKGGFFKGLLFELGETRYLIKFQNDNINQNMEDFSNGEDDDDTGDDDDLDLDINSDDIDNDDDDDDNDDDS